MKTYFSRCPFCVLTPFEGQKFSTLMKSNLSSFFPPLLWISVLDTKSLPNLWSQRFSYVFLKCCSVRFIFKLKVHTSEFLYKVRVVGWIACASDTTDNAFLYHGPHQDKSYFKGEVRNSSVIKYSLYYFYSGLYSLENNFIIFKLGNCIMLISLHLVICTAMRTHPHTWMMCLVIRI